ncbi:UDP-N-acetylmuramoyl-L-alanyl-D-glutamate--2,6-diaminopimelate ligase, partial [bacterium]|nr:UDP-N-acetylmuramoyl-L-alanyl-D-glutamate--2,6-diaminopimelate ligase [bacterium]
HAISQKRAHNINLDAAVFTNLSQDHLDYHKNMNEYFAEKEKLFTEVLAASNKKNKCMVINNDCPYGSKIEEVSGTKKITYGQENADITFNILSQTLQGSVFKINTPRGSKEVSLPQPGLYNIYNAVAAIGAGLCADVSLDSCVESLKDFKGVPGRLESVENEQNLNIFVDYAHTDDALTSVLSTLNIIKGDSNVICVVGCGGDRDKAKRPKMFAAAKEGADKVIVTSDNPRTEDPQKIIDDMLAGEKPSEDVVVEIDRKKAIEKAIQLAQKNDVILIAGKGHEDYQIIGEERLPFSDVEVVKGMLS